MSADSKQTILFNNVYIQGVGTVGGKVEKEGPIGAMLDFCYDDHYCGEKTYEKAERLMATEAIGYAIKSGGINAGDIDLAIGGDLLNQIISSNYIAKDIKAPFIGVYGACSTSMLSLGLAANFIEANTFKQVLAFTSSHNATAERQFRYPNEYGGQKKPTTTFTATGAGAVILGNKPNKIKVEAVTFGRVVDLEQNDPNDMGTAMAPAAYDTIKAHFNDLNRNFEDYDLVVTGDLSKVGHAIVKELFDNDGLKTSNYNDCGLILYDLENQEVFSGGSGCACSALVTYGYIVKQMLSGMYKNVLIVATGALLSPVSTAQKENIPCVAHAIALKGGQ